MGKVRTAGGRSFALALVFILLAGFGSVFCAAEAEAKEFAQEETVPERWMEYMESRNLRFPLRSGLLEGAGEEEYIRLRTEEGVYLFIEKQKGSQGGYRSPSHSYDTPADWNFGYPNWEICLDSCSSAVSDARVYVHVTENSLFTGNTQEMWPIMRQQITAASQSDYGLLFSVPKFEHYYMDDGKELFFYEFFCNTGEKMMQYAVAYVSGQDWLAEFIGRSPWRAGEEATQLSIAEVTRYMAASFTENGGEKITHSLKYRPYLGAEGWPWEKLHNPFAMAAEMYAPVADAALEGKDYDVKFVSPQWEDLLRKVTAYHYDMTDAQKKKLSSRPLKASELAWITEVTLTESPIPGRDKVLINGLTLRDAVLDEVNLTTVKDLAALPNLKKLKLDSGSVTDYEGLKNCRHLTELAIASPKPMQNVEWLAELKELKSLTLTESQMTHLVEMGYRKDEPSTFQNPDGTPKVYPEGSAPAGALEHTLAGCTSLEYLSLNYAGSLDFSFLSNMPELYAFRLDGEDEDSDAAKARQGALGENSFPQIQCLVVDDMWLRNPE